MTSAGAGDVAVASEAIVALAAMAAAAIASGAVALPDGGEAAAVAGTSVNATGAAIATATIFCIVTAAAAGSAMAAMSVEDEVAWSPEAGFVADLPAPVFELVDFVPGCWTESGVAPELSLEGALALASSELSLTDGPVAPALFDWLLSEEADVSMERRGGGAGSGAGELEGPLLASAAVLLSTSAPKISFPCAEADRADLDGGAP
jgi:hypothetical protein